MKMTCPQSMKFMKLKRRLRVPHWQVVGLLESLWLFTQMNAPAGDVGRFSNEDIAAGLEWDSDADEMIGMLIDCGFLDECEDNRLIVHDWEEHAPTYLKGAMAKNKRQFAKQGAKHCAKQDGEQGAKQDAKQDQNTPEQSAPSLTLPNLALPNQINTFVANATTAAGISVEEFFSRWQKFAETKSLPVPRRLSAGLKAKIDSRLKSVEWFTDFKAAIAKLPLGGDWQPDLVWLVANDDNAGKVASGKYDNWKKNGHAEPKVEQPPPKKLTPISDLVKR